MSLDLTITRTDVSPYQAQNFVKFEEKMVTDLGFKYSLSEKAPHILFTNTLTDMWQLHKRIDLNQLRLIVHSNSGYDNFPLSFIEQSRVSIVLGNEIRANAVCEYTLAQLFERFSSTPHKPQWDLKRAFKRRRIKDLTCLVIGKGPIGNQLLNTLHSLGCEPLSYDPYKGPTAPLEDLVKVCDVILLAASLNQTSFHMINEKILNLCKPDLTIINPARGSLINTSDLIIFLNKHPHSFAYLDVFEKEPRDLPELEILPNVKLTSHIAGVFDQLDQAIIQFEKSVLEDFSALNLPAFRQKYESKLLNNRCRNGMLI